MVQATSAGEQRGGGAVQLGPEMLVRSQQWENGTGLGLPFLRGMESAKVRSAVSRIKEEGEGGD